MAEDGIPADQDREATRGFFGNPDGPGMEKAADHLGGPQRRGDVDRRGAVELLRAETREQRLNCGQAEAVGYGAGPLVERDRVRTLLAPQAGEGRTEVVETFVPARAAAAQAGMFQTAFAVMKLGE